MDKNKIKQFIKKHPVWVGIIIFVWFSFTISPFISEDNTASSSNINTDTAKQTQTEVININENQNEEEINIDYEQTETESVKSEPSAIEMMEVVFIGGYSKKEIKTLLDDIMELNGLKINEENYQRVGSVLVSLRKETGVSEIEILTCMKYADYRNSVGGNISPEKAITDSSAICATMLSS